MHEQKTENEVAVTNEDRRSMLVEGKPVILHGGSCDGDVDVFAFQRRLDLISEPSAKREAKRNSIHVKGLRFSINMTRPDSGRSVWHPILSKGRTDP